MQRKQKRIQHIFLSLALFGFVGSIFIFCTEHILEASGIENENCLTMIGHHSNLCTNDVASHLAWWQSLQTVFLQERFFLLLASLVFIGGVFSLIQFTYFTKRLFQLGKRYLSYQPDIPIYFSLRRLFFKRYSSFKSIFSRIATSHG